MTSLRMQDRRNKAAGIARWFLACLSLFLMARPAAGQEELPALVKKISPSIAVVLTYDAQGNAIGKGTGFFIEKNGDVITNFHVLQGAGRAEVKLSEEKTYAVKGVVAADPEGDLIRLSTDTPREEVHPLRVSPTQPEVGERIFVIGAPMGLDKTVSDGIISAVRKIPEFGTVLQVTAPISPGSSGSPVVNMRGEVIGIATFFIMTGQNLNFAIPGERIARLTPVAAQTLAERKEQVTEKDAAFANLRYAGGLRYLWLEEYEKALFSFIEAIQRDPSHGESYFWIGYCFAKLNRFAEAVAPYKKALEMRPRDARVPNNLCMVYGKIGQYPEAVQSCKEALKLQPDLAEAHNNLAWVYNRLGRYPEAIQACKQAIRLKPELASAHFNLGNQYAAQKKYPDAAESFKEAIRIDFDYAESHLNLGAAYSQMRRLEEAVESFRQAIRLQPSLAAARLNLGLAYLKMGNRGSAIEEYKTLKGLDPESADKLFHLIYE